jgi:hypothetical protein
VKEFFGGLLMGIGLLVMTLSGLCSGFFLVSTLGSGGDLSIFTLIVLFGGVPFIGGLGMFFGGRELWRAGRRERGFD